MGVITGAFTIAVLLQLCASPVFSENAEKALLKQLLGSLKPVDRIARPVNNESEAVNVKIGMTLTLVEDFDEKRQIISITGWINYGWTDPQLSWVPADHNGIKRIYVPPNAIWKPDIQLYNKIGAGSPSGEEVLAVVGNDGSVLWIPPSEYRIKCSKDTTPDKYQCTFKFGSWVYDGNKVDLQLAFDDLDTASLAEDNTWKVTNTSATRNAVTYECCPEPYIDVTFRLTLQKRADED